MSTLTDTVASLTTPEQLVELLDPEVMWYSVDVNSNFTCNDKDDAAACIERNVASGGVTGRFEVLGESDDAVAVRPVLDPPLPDDSLCMLLRFRDGLIVEMRDFETADGALAYLGAAA